MIKRFQLYEFSGAYGISTDLQFLKNRDADATNPNIYSSIEKLEHLYDEIKQKDVGEYKQVFYFHVLRYLSSFQIELNISYVGIAVWK